MKKEIFERLSTLITVAFALVAALAWNAAVQSIFVYFFGERSSIPAMLIYAIVITIIAVIITIWFSKFVSNKT